MEQRREVVSKVDAGTSYCYNIDTNLLLKEKSKSDTLNTTEEIIDKYDKYNMSHPSRGIALIINNMKYDNISMGIRAGAESDEEALIKILSSLSFSIRLCKDMTWIEIKEELLQVAKQNHTMNDCLFVAIMTHGEQNGILYSRDVAYRADDVWNTFNAKTVPSLVGKPKIFLVQACRGTKFEDNGLMIDSIDSGHPPASARNLILPSNADFLIAYSSMEGYYSFRNSMEGTWFIQDFCKELRENVHEKDFLSILTRTLRRVAYLRSSFNPTIPDMDGKRQMPVFSSTLTRDLYFYDKKKTPEEPSPLIKVIYEAGNDEIDRQAHNVIEKSQPDEKIIRSLNKFTTTEYELDDFDCYEANDPIKGVALIFNHRVFLSSSVETRECANKDGEVLSETLSHLGFNVRPYKDKSVQQIKDILADVAKEDHSGLDCFLVVIMTHGEENGVLHAYDDTYKTKEVWERFTQEKVPSLAGKPKIFLFQACRGEKSQESTEIIDSLDFPTSGKSIVPSQADFLLGYSCVEGHISFKNKEGSWFIQDLCTELNKNSKKKDILVILTDTFRRVVLTRKSNIPDKMEVHKKQQIPAFNSTLTKLLYL